MKFTRSLQIIYSVSHYIATITGSYAYTHLYIVKLFMFNSSFSSTLPLPVVINKFIFHSNNIITYHEFKKYYHNNNYVFCHSCQNHVVIATVTGR